MTEQQDFEGELREARRTIERQAVEIESLRASQADTRFAAELRLILSQAGVASALQPPPETSDLLERLLQTAAVATAAQAGSLLLVDDEGRNLVFKAATGPKAAEVRRFVVPLGSGIAGFVAETGQPMALANVNADPRFHHDIGQSLGYIPQTMLCVPIQHDDAIIGVIQLLDKAGGASFTQWDIELVGRFVEQAALAVEQSRALENLSDLLVSALRRLAGPDAVTADVDAAARAFVGHVNAAAVQSEALALARTIAEIGQQGEAELRLVHTWLMAFRQYLDTRAGLLY